MAGSSLTLAGEREVAAAEFRDVNREQTADEESACYIGVSLARLKLGEFAQIAEIVAAVGVIASLVYVGAELRSNTAMVRAATVHAITTSSREVLVDVALDEDFARIRQLGESDRASLTEAEAFRFSQFSRQNWLYFQSVWIQYNLDVVDERAWESYRRIFCGLVTLPGNRAEWPNHSVALDPDFVEIVESCAA